MTESKKFHIVLSTPKRKFPLFSWAIRLFEGFFDSSHALIRWYSDSLEEFLNYHATVGSMNFMGNEAYHKNINPKHVYQVIVDEETFKEIMKYCVKKSGSGYDFKSILRQGIFRVFKIDAPWLSSGEDRQFCVEFLAILLNKKLNIKLKKAPELMGLRDLKELLDSNDIFFKIS